MSDLYFIYIKILNTISEKLGYGSAQKKRMPEIGKPQALNLRFIHFL